MKDSKFKVYYLRHTMILADEKKSWRSVTQFINFLDSFGGYAYLIEDEDGFIYKRKINEEDGTDQWYEFDGYVFGKEVNLEKIKHRR